MKDRKLVSREHAIEVLERAGYETAVAVKLVDECQFEHRGMLVVRRFVLSQFWNVLHGGEEGGDAC